MTHRVAEYLVCLTHLEVRAGLTSDRGRGAPGVRRAGKNSATHVTVPHYPGKKVLTEVIFNRATKTSVVEPLACRAARHNLGEPYREPAAFSEPLVFRASLAGLFVR